MRDLKGITPEVMIRALSESIATTLRREGIALVTYGKLGLDLQLTSRVCEAIAREAVRIAVEEGR